MLVTGQVHPMGRGSRASYAMRWGAGGPPLDYDWIGRDGDGVWMTVHPDAALLDAPEVAEVYEAFRRHPELTRADQETMSAYDYALAHEFVSARSALAARQMESQNG